jgi:S-adenosylmethionine synthetase
MGKILFTSESVTEGHPDKMCDQISDAVLDEIIRQDPSGRVACETAMSKGLVLVMGQISTSCYVDIPKIARNTIRNIGYDRAKYGFDADTCAVLTSIDDQSPDIAMGVDCSAETKAGDAAGNGYDLTGAGDQGMMFGFASDETPELMPMPIMLAHRLARQLSLIRKEKQVNYLRPDGKTQVTIEYVNGKPERVDTVIVSTQHDDKVPIEQLREEIKKLVIYPIIPKDLMDDDIKILINPTGRFVLGGPAADSGLTGRKIIVDTYGGYARHGGGCFSGKDPTKVDRSATYAARHVAKNIVAAGLAKKCEIQIAYAIGVAHPVSVMVDTYGTGKYSDDKLIRIIRDNFDLRPEAIIEDLRLRRPIYLQTAAYGHFGWNEPDYTWEMTDKADRLK